MAIKFGRTGGLRWERLTRGSSTRYRKRRKEKKAFMHGAAVKTRIYTNESNHRLLQIWMNCRAKIVKGIGKRS